MNNKKVTWSTLALAWFLSYAAGARGQTQPQAFGPAFDIKASPTPGDWQRFHILEDKALRDLWSFHAQKKLGLKDWAWQWRLAWVRSCGKASRRDWCEPILKDGIFDAAMVVRADAAEQWANIRVGKATREDVALLKKAYLLSGNRRHAKPLFVCEKILRALDKLGTKESRATALALARKDKQTLAYWTSLQNAQQKQKL